MGTLKRRTHAYGYELSLLPMIQDLISSWVLDMDPIQPLVKGYISNLKHGIGNRGNLQVVDFIKLSFFLHCHLNLFELQAVSHYQ